jgi:hypothetical protein
MLLPQSGISMTGFEFFHAFSDALATLRQLILDLEVQLLPD